MHEALRAIGEVRPLRDPVLIAAFSGLNDFGGAALAAVDHLCEQWGARDLAEIEPEPFFDFTVQRPIVRLDGERRTIDWPTPKFRVASPGGADRDFLLLSSADRFVGLHFFNPAPAMRLVEVVRTVTTSDEAFARAAAFARALGKEPVAAKDHSGFIVNLLLIPYLLDAIRAVERGVATIEDIDAGMRLGAAHPMGPLALADFIGLDTLHSIAGIMHAEHHEARYGAPPLLRRMVHAGMYGRKSGLGFYDYAADPPAPAALGL